MLNLTSLFESYPKNPDTIIVQNEFYKRGLTEKEIYEYYVHQKSKILEQVKDREIMFFIGVDVNKTIVKRKTPEDDFFKLTNENYETLITGRTLSIHSTMKQKENIGIIDVDFNNFEIAKTSTMEVYDYIFKNHKHLNPTIRFTGKTSFHIICEFKKQEIDITKAQLKNILLKFQNDENYSVSSSRKEGKVNLDLSSNKIKGGFITLHSLSVIGLRCIEIPRQKMKPFQAEDAMI